MLHAALSAEVDEFLGRSRYQRGDDFRGYRNGHLPARTVGVGMGAVEIRQPRVRDLPEGVEPFRSEVVGRWERRSRTQGRLLARLYLEGLATGDFEPVFRELVGATAALSPASILRLKQEWEDEYRLWRGRPLTERYIYVFADGLYLKAGLEKEKTAMLIEPPWVSWRLPFLGGSGPWHQREPGSGGTRPSCVSGPSGWSGRPSSTGVSATGW